MEGSPPRLTWCGHRSLAICSAATRHPFRGYTRRPELQLDEMCVRYHNANVSSVQILYVLSAWPD